MNKKVKSPIDWSNLTASQVVAAWKEMPGVAGPWEKTGTVWVRYSINTDHLVIAYVLTDGKRFQSTLTWHPTLKNAKREADEKLKADGWLLLNDKVK